MPAEFVRERITQLRMQKGVSEYKMSYDLGHSQGYINNIPPENLCRPWLSSLLSVSILTLRPSTFLTAG